MERYKVTWTFKFGDIEMNNFKHYTSDETAMLCLSSVIANAAFLGLSANLIHSECDRITEEESNELPKS